MIKNKVLVIGPAWVGDMVMAQSLFKLLKQQQPERSIDVLAPAFGLPLLLRMPEVAESLVMPIGHGKLALPERYRMGKALREKQYQQAIVLPNSFKSALIPFWADIPVRTGWSGEMRYGVLNDRRHLDKKRYPLMIEQFMALGLPPDAALPAEYPLPELRVSSIQREEALTRFALTKDRPILAICPGAEFGPAKRWPEAHYAALSNEKLRQGFQVWIFGSPRDQTVAEHIMALTDQRCVNLAGKTSLSDAIDLLSQAAAVVSNDSGLMHIAAALHKPLVAVYGPTSAAFTPPLDDQAKKVSLALACQPCFQRVCPLKHHRCMKDLQPEIVMNALADLSCGS
ncbi:MAG TPA: lipopolysaccharide heptosyltransferase II [Gammaproteobacteria bacterium]|nr:lipopolysaccharide heptosyltransferase II [Gammaproteobacteria bacterium]